MTLMVILLLFCLSKKVTKKDPAINLQPDGGGTPIGLGYYCEIGLGTPMMWFCFFVSSSFRKNAATKTRKNGWSYCLMTLMVSVSLSFWYLMK
jgi:hypothetical protein